MAEVVNNVQTRLTKGSNNLNRQLAIAALGIAIGLAGPVQATQTLFTDFEGFKVGASIENQNGWSSDNPAWDEEVVNAGGNTVWRVSNAVTSGTFGDMPFAPRLGGIPLNTVTNPTNDSPGAFAGESSTGTSLKVFNAKFSFRSAKGFAQPGARITVSADNGQGGRQSFIAINDTGAGLEISTFDVDSSTGNFIGPIVIATGLSYTRWHTTSVEIRFRDGPSNDVVRYFVNAKRVHTNGSWEQFYRLDPNNEGQDVLHPLGVPVQTLLFRLSGNPVPTVAGGGYYIDKLSLSVSKSGEIQNDDGDGDDDDSDGKSSHDEKNSYRVHLGAGEDAQYALTAGPDTIMATAVLADGQTLVMDILDPVGGVVASSLPSVGPAILTVPTVLPGDYTMRVRNIGVSDVASKLTLIRSNRR